MSASKCAKGLTALQVVLGKVSTQAPWASGRARQAEGDPCGEMGLGEQDQVLTVTECDKGRRPAWSRCGRRPHPWGAPVRGPGQGRGQQAGQAQTAAPCPVEESGRVQGGPCRQGVGQSVSDRSARLARRPPARASDATAGFRQHLREASGRRATADVTWTRRDRAEAGAEAGPGAVPVRIQHCLELSWDSLPVDTRAARLSPHTSGCPVGSGVECPVHGALTSGARPSPNNFNPAPTALEAQTTGSLECSRPVCGHVARHTN